MLAQGKGKARELQVIPEGSSDALVRDVEQPARGLGQFRPELGDWAGFGERPITLDDSAPPLH